MFKLWKKPAVISALIVIIGNRINCQCLYREEAQNGSTRSKVFCKIGVFKTFIKFKRKHLCQSIFFIKLQAFFYRTLPVTASVKKKKKTAALKLKTKSIRFIHTSFLTRKQESHGCM